MKEPTNDYTQNCLDKEKVNTELLIKGAIALALLFDSKKDDKLYIIPPKTEKEKQVEEYFGDNYCFCHEKEKTISMKRSSISLQELKDISEILKVENLTFEVSHDYDGDIESEINWEE